MKRTRKPTTAEIHAARLAGLPDPVEVEVDTTSAGEVHRARIVGPRTSAKPPTMSSADWYAQRVRERNAAERAGRSPVGEEELEEAEEPVEVDEAEEVEAPAAGGSWGPGRRSFRSGDEVIVG